ncbi:hypothetical protein CDL15_Pgr001181 [Punica granatum]|uniref:protein-serine/threonine phosphatase n=1 Tax=Punica granatum TaxID=22663 RepID=A0A218WJQ3_PUNGR|nr:hypothetical protein CDL15_Pgr001181 [Punica granatum]
MSVLSESELIHISQVWNDNLEDDFASFLDTLLSDSDGEEDLESKRVKRHKVEVLDIPEITHEPTTGAGTSKIEDICAHPGTFGNMCILCGQRIDEDSSVSLGYIHKTMGDRPYAREMAKLLDPRNEYFNAKVISRDDGTQKHQKGLDVVLGQESAVLILDDTENAWIKHKDNVILMERYHFFASSCQQFGFSCKSLSELKSDECETDGALAVVLRVLKRVHSLFFDELGDSLPNRDVREVLKTVRKEILQGCKIVFSRVFPTSFPAESHQLWKMAEQLGATCSVDLSHSVTHVVAADPKTEKSRWAVKEKKFLVHPRWIEAAYYLWKRLPEDNYSVRITPCL